MIRISSHKNSRVFKVLIGAEAGTDPSLSYFFFTFIDTLIYSVSCSGIVRDGSLLRWMGARHAHRNFIYPSQFRQLPALLCSFFILFARNRAGRAGGGVVSFYFLPFLVNILLFCVALFPAACRFISYIFEKRYTMTVVLLKWYPIPTKVQCAHTAIK